MPDDKRILAACCACLMSCLPACERVLDVVDEIEPPGSDPSGSGGSPAGGGGGAGSTDEACACASSPGLQALSCGMAPVPLLDSDVVQTTADGGIVAFNVCDDVVSECRVAYWNGITTYIVSSGTLLGLSASGQRVLSTGDGIPSGLELTDLGGTGTFVLLRMLPGRGSLSAAGDVVFGADWDEDRKYLARADADTGEVERLGEIAAALVRSYVTPDASKFVGWGFEDIEGSAATTVYRWNEVDGLTVGLPGVAADRSVWPEAISADASVLAGRAGASHFRYTEADGLVEITSTTGRSETFLSRDGSVVIGSNDPDEDGGTATFRWTAQSGAVNLTPGVQTLAVDASDDGGVVVASSWEEEQLQGADPQQTLIWDGEHGTRSLEQVLQDRGIDASGWEFGHARAISGNGKVLVGRARCGGAPTLYRVVLAD